MNSSWNKDWLEVQRQYMEVLTSMGTLATEQSSGKIDATDWQQALRQWWPGELTEKPGDMQSMFSNLLQHSNSWEFLSEQFNELIRSVSSEKESQSGWQRTLEKQIELIKAQIQSGKMNTGGKNWHGDLSTPIDNWHHMFNSLCNASASPESLPLDMQGFIAKLSSFSGMETTRPVQEQMQEGLKLWQSYYKNYEAYRETLTKMDLNSLDKLQEKIVELGSQNKAISSLRDLYNLWVESQEEAYLQIVKTDEYSVLYGQLVNSLLQFKAHNNNFMSEAIEGLNLSSKGQQDALEKELRDIKQQQEEDKKRMMRLEKELNKLKADSDKDSSKLSKKKTSRKKAKKTKSKSSNTDK